MQRLAREGNLVYTCSPANRPKLRVQPGEQFQVDTELNTGTWLQSLADSPIGRTAQFPYVNPTTGPVEVEGAHPGSALAVHIDAIDVAGLGYTQIVQGKNPFKNWIRGDEWGDQFRVVQIADDLIHWSDQQKIPTRPMIGVIGTAPEIEAISNIDNGPHGGNLDAQEVAAGNTIYLPVFVGGGLLHMGDVHALQGDGELCCAGGIETRATLTVRVDVVPKPPGMTWPRVETPNEIVTVGCARPLEDAFRLAVQEMVYWLEHEYGVSQPDALMFLGQVARARATQIVNPKYTYVCSVDKPYLAAYEHKLL